MAEALLLIVGVLVMLFGFVVLFGAPYLPTLRPQQEQALHLLGLKKGQTLVELGSGDGRLLKAAAAKGINAIGYELNPILFVYSWLTTRRYKGLVHIKLANFWRQELPACDGIYVFLLERYMSKLHNKVTQEITSSVKVVSFAFPIEEATLITEKNGLFLYKYSVKK